MICRTNWNEFVVFQFKTGKILVADCGDAVLCLITDNDIALGMARMTINQAAREIEVLLDVLVEEEWAGFDDEEEIAYEPIPDDQKALEEDGFLSDLQSALRELEHF